MEMLREIRVRRCLTQQQMADKCRISRQRWSQIEAGLSLPPPEVAEELAEFGPIPSALDMFSGQQLRQWFLTVPYQLKLVNRDPWEKALRNWGYWIGKLGVDGRTRQWMMGMLESESALEAYGWFQVAALNGRPQIYNPHEAGFGLHPVVDRLDRLLGERRLPGLYGQTEGIRFVAWPQISLRLRSIFRLDGLIWLRKGVKGAWAMLEFNGPTHETEYDKTRKALLGLPDITVTESDIKALRVAAIFRKQAQKILELGNASTGVSGC